MRWQCLLRSTARRFRAAGCWVVAGEWAARSAPEVARNSSLQGKGCGKRGWASSQTQGVCEPNRTARSPCVTRETRQHSVKAS